MSPLLFAHVCSEALDANVRELKTTYEPGDIERLKIAGEVISCFEAGARAVHEKQMKQWEGKPWDI